MGPNVSEITRRPMWRTGLGRGDQWGRLGEVAEAQVWAGAGGLSDKEEEGTMVQTTKKLFRLTSYWVGNAIHRVVLTS